MVYFFRIEGQYLSCTNSSDKTIITDSSNYHMAKFFFDSSWDNLSKTITFTNSKDGTSINMLLTLEGGTACYIPHEVLLTEGSLIVCVGGNINTTNLYTKMTNQIDIVKSDKTSGSTPTNPTQSVYDQIMQELTLGAVGSIYLPNKEILVSDWSVVSGIVNITSTFTPQKIVGTVSMRVAHLGEYLNNVSYPYTDFYLTYSLDGSTTSQIVSTGETVATPSQRKIRFIINGNSYEVKITSTKITIKLVSGTDNIYIHNLSLRFDDYYYYDYVVSGLTQYHLGAITIKDESLSAIKNITFTRNPTFTNDTIRLNFSQLPTGIIYTKFLAIRTKSELNTISIENTYGSAAYVDISSELIDDNSTTHDNEIATIYQIKEYVNRKLGL